MGECFRIAIVQTGECFARCLLSNILITKSFQP